MADLRRRLGHVTSSETLFMTPQSSVTQRFGEGDSDAYSHGGGPTMAPLRSGQSRTKRFGNNGARIPVFYASEAEEGVDINENHVVITPPVWDGKFPALNSTQMTQLMEFFECPICLDLMVEATAPLCGHGFCSGCLEKWTCLKPVCPICSKQVTHRIRLYNEDLLIESMINRCEDFPQEIARRLYEASKSRMDRAQMAEISRFNLLGRLRESVDDITNSLKCKGFLQTIRNSGPSRAIQRFWKRSKPEVGSEEGVPASASMSSRYGAKFYTSTGVVLGFIMAWSYFKFFGAGAGEFNFLYYLYLCITHYNGSIPDFLKMTPEMPLMDEISTGGDASWWNWIRKFISQM